MKPTARELLDRLHANCPLAVCPACQLNARVEKVLAYCEAAIDDREQGGNHLISAEVVERLLNGEE